MRVAPLQRGAGGCSHSTPAQGSGLQAPALQPNAQVVSICVYVQPFVPHEPGESKLRRTLPMHTDCGGARQPWQASFTHEPSVHPKAQTIGAVAYWQAPVTQLPGAR